MGAMAGTLTEEQQRAVDEFGRCVDTLNVWLARLDELGVSPIEAFRLKLAAEGQELPPMLAMMLGG